MVVVGLLGTPIQWVSCFLWIPTMGSLLGRHSWCCVAAACSAQAAGLLWPQMSPIAPLNTLFLWSSWHPEEDHITMCPTEEARLHKWSSRNTLCLRYMLGCGFHSFPLSYSLPQPYFQGHCQPPVRRPLLIQPYFCIQASQFLFGISVSLSL